MTAKKTPSHGAAGSMKGRNRPPESYLEGAEVKQITTLEDLGLTPEEAVVAEAEIERQLASTEEEARVNMRWGRDQLSAVQKAAKLAGVPYQTYIKLVAFQRAVGDIEAAKKAGIG